MINEILLRRKNLFILPQEYKFAKSINADMNKRYLATLMSNAESLGYTFSRRLIKYLSTQTNDYVFININNNIIPILKQLVGANVKYKPFYINFPSSVMEADTADLYINAIIHYLTYGNYRPTDMELQRPELTEKHNLKVIDYANYEDVVKIFKNLCQSKTSLSSTDLSDIKEIFNEFEYKFIHNNIFDNMEFPFKENRAFIGKILYDEYHTIGTPIISLFISEKTKCTATDILRFITALSSGDVSLSKNTYYINFTRKERLDLMLLLSTIPYPDLIEGMIQYKEKWIRVGERLHPGEKKYRKDPRFKDVTKAFDQIRNNKNNVKLGYNSSVEKLSLKISEHKASVHDIIDLAYLLHQNPGIYARKLDFLLRNSTNNAVITSYIVRDFEPVASKISIPVLLQLYAHFLYRDEEIKKNIRVFFPKGSVAKCYYKDNDLCSIPKETCDEIVKICRDAIITILREEKPHDMGNVYLSESFKKYLIPSSQRSASKALKPITRGSRLPIEENTNVLRAFIWWTNLENGSRVDLDLSAAFYDEDMEYLSHINYTNLKLSRFGTSVHSGDIINGGPYNGDGASEFIDVDLKSLNPKVRYIVFTANNFTGQQFNEMDNHAMFGWMSRESMNDGKIYEPSTVTQRIDMNSESCFIIPAIFDVKTNEYIWCDIINPSGTFDSIRTKLDSVTGLCYALCNMHKVNLYDLIMMNVEARDGHIVDKVEDANIVFDEETGDVTPFDIDTIIGNYM